MKIAFLCLAFYAYVISANEESDEQPVPRHSFIQGHSRLVPYRPPVQPRPWPVPQFRPLPQPRPQPPRMSIIDRFVLSYFIYRALTPATTTASTTTTVPISTTTTTTTTTTANPLADWTEVGDCYYIFPESAATWNDAKAACEGLVEGGRLAVDGFNQNIDGRRAVTNALGWATGDGSFWIGAQLDVSTSTATVIGVDPSNFGGTVSGTTDPISCGRVASVNDVVLNYDACDGPESRYVCESCL